MGPYPGYDARDGWLPGDGPVLRFLERMLAGDETARRTWVPAVGLWVAQAPRETNTPGERPRDPRV